MQVKGGGAGAGASAAPGGPSGARRAPCPAPGRGEEGGVVLNYIGGDNDGGNDGNDDGGHDDGHDGGDEGSEADLRPRHHPLGPHHLLSHPHGLGRGVSPTNQPPGLGWRRWGWGGRYSPW